MLYKRGARRIGVRTALAASAVRALMFLVASSRLALAQGSGAAAVAVLAKQPVIQYAPIITHTWSLLYREFKTEFLGCLYGSVRASARPLEPDTVTISYMLLADVKPSHSTDRGVAEKSPCPASDKLLGMVHSHPGGRTCVHDGRGNCAPIEADRQGDICFPSRTDQASFAASRYVIDVIVCGENTFIASTRDLIITRCEYDPEADWPLCTNGPKKPGTAKEEIAALP